MLVVLFVLEFGAVFDFGEIGTLVLSKEGLKIRNVPFLRGPGSWDIHRQHAALSTSQGLFAPETIQEYFLWV